MRLFWSSRFGFVLLACGVLPACSNHYDMADPPAAPSPAASTTPTSREPARPVEACNGLDDNGDGVVDEGTTCKITCSADAIARAAASLRLPRSDDETVPRGERGNAGGTDHSTGTRVLHGSDPVFHERRCDSWLR